MTPPSTISSEAEQLAADAVGDVIEHWGFRKTLGRVWAVLYLAGEPLPAVVLQERLQMSAGATSMALSELQEWSVVRRVWRPGERREFFEAETDLWKMISKVVSERERFLVASVRERLGRSAELLESQRTVGARLAAARVRQLLSFADISETIIASFLASRRADFTRLGNLVHIAGRVSSRARRIGRPSR
jgi:HTH-type transcriptional regulator, glycine betaine synthesis regulator